MSKEIPMYERELKAMIDAARKAEIHIMKVYQTDFAVEIKDDDSPVTIADKGADEIIRRELSIAFPDYGFLTEESKDTGERKNKEFIFVVDPVDGTSDFVAKDDQFCTNIALVKGHEVVAGVINLPGKHTVYFAVKGQGSYRLNPDGKITRLHVSSRKEGLRSMRSISHFNEKESRFYQEHEDRFDPFIEPVGAAYKFCLIAEGKKEFFIRISAGTKEWDVAAGDIILTEAGGVLVEPNGKPFTYNRDDVYNRNGYVMANCPENLLLEGQN